MDRDRLPSLTGLRFWAALPPAALAGQQHADHNGGS
ncbi:peptidoglycan/LPS O-acetylase OafA/YrhL [Streptacidiphilus sp. EB103A]